MRQAENERSEWPKGHYRFEELVVVRLSENEHSEVYPCHLKMAG